MQLPQKESFALKARKRLNTFRTGFITGIVATALVGAGISHAVFNVFKLGDVSFGRDSTGIVASPITDTTETQVADSGNSEENTTLEKSDRNAVVRNNSRLNQTDESTGVSDLSAGGDINVTIEYKDNSELPGFDPNKGYQSSPPNIGQFDDALLVNNVSLGSSFFKPETQDVFINGKKYRSTFYLTPDKSDENRVAFSIDNLPKPKAVFFQFGLRDLNSGTTTLTYRVKISADGELLWSGQLKYDEQQIVSVVLDVDDYNDVLFEYQIVESGDVSYYQNPIYFTEAKLLFD